MGKTNSILIPISPAELIDKICILEIKAEKITDPEKNKNIKNELEKLLGIWQEKIVNSPALESLKAKLKAASLRGWEAEDIKRACEREEDFGTRFIAAARTAYQNNDDRAAIWKEINLLLKSDIVQEKSYEKY